MKRHVSIAAICGNALEQAGCPHACAIYCGNWRNAESLLCTSQLLIQGDLLLAMCFYHNFVDAYGVSRIIARLAEHCGGSAAVTGAYDGSVNDGMPDIFNVEAIRSAY